MFMNYKTSLLVGFAASGRSPTRQWRAGRHRGAPALAGAFILVKVNTSAAIDSGTSMSAPATKEDQTDNTTDR